MVKKAVLIGTGGVGTVAALALEHGGQCEVTIVARSIYETVTKHGFDVESVDYGNIPGWRPSKITDSVSKAAENGPFDFVVVTTKNVPEVQRIEDIIRPLVTPGRAIVLIQNGIGGEEQLMSAFPDSYVIGGISLIGSAIYGNKLQHTHADHLLVGTYDKRAEAQEALKGFFDLYSSSKSKTELVHNLRYRRWTKLVYNSTFNTTAAATGLDVARLLLSDLTYSLVLPAMKELRAIAEAELGESLPEDVEQTTIDSHGGFYFEPSMLVDIKKGQPIEIEVILGNPLRIAKKLGVQAPILTIIYRILHGLQFKALENRGLLAVPTEPFDTANTKPVYPLDL